MQNSDTPSLAKPTQPSQPALETKADVETKKLVIGSEAHFKVLGREPIVNALATCTKKYESRNAEVVGDDPIANCVETLLEAKVDYPPKFELKFKYVGHLTSTEGFVKQGERVQLLESEEKLIVSNSKVTSMAEWEQLEYLLVHLYFLIDLYVQVNFDRTAPPAFCTKEVALDRLFREIQITANAFRFRVAYQLVLTSPLDEKTRLDTLESGIKEFLQSLDDLWKEFIPGDVAVLPIGGTGHALYLVIVKDKFLKGEMELNKSFAHFRVDNFLKNPSKLHKPDGQKLYPRILFSLEAGALAKYVGGETQALNSPDLISYLVGICQAKFTGIEIANATIYLTGSIAKKVNVNVMDSGAAKDYSQYYFSQPEQDTATCVVHNFKAGIQYRLQTRANFYDWFNQLEIRAAFKDWEISSQMTAAEKWKRFDLDYEEHLSSIGHTFQRRLQKKYLEQKFLKPVFSTQNAQEISIEQDFIDLDLTIKPTTQDGILPKKEVQIELTQIFESSNSKTKAPEKIHIAGVPGSGKSVLFQFLAVTWATAPAADDKETSNNFQRTSQYLRQKFNSIIWIKLKEVDEEIDLYQFMLNQFYMDAAVADKPSQETLEQYVDTNKKSILFLIDGYSDIENNSNHPGQHIIRQIFAKGLYIILTSNTCPIGPLNFDLHLVNKGFSDEGIEIFIKKAAVKELAEHKEEVIGPHDPHLMINFLKSRSDFWKMAHVPINLELSCRLWLKNHWDVKSISVISSSFLIQSFVKKLSNISGKKIRHYDLDDALNLKISTKPTIQDLIEPFLEELAFQNIEQSTLIIDPKLLKEVMKKILEKEGSKGASAVKYHLPILTVASNPLSFLKKVETTTEDVALTKAQFTFTNQTFQEFFAASHVRSVLVNDNEEEKEHLYKKIKIHKYNPKYLRVWSIATGLLYQYGKNNRDFTFLNNFWEKGLLANEPDLLGMSHMRLICLCLEECEASFELPIHKELMKQVTNWFWWCINAVEKRGDGLWEIKFFTDTFQNCSVLKSSPIFIKQILKAICTPDLFMKIYPTTVLLYGLSAPIELINGLIEIIKAPNKSETKTLAALLISTFEHLPEGCKPQLRQLLIGNSLGLDKEGRGYIENALEKPKSIIKRSAKEFEKPQEPLSLTTILEEQNEQKKSELLKNYFLLNKLSVEEANSLLITALEEKNEHARDTIVSALARTDFNPKMVQQFLEKATSTDISEDPSLYDTIITFIKVEGPTSSNVAFLNNLVITTLLKALENKDASIREHAAKRLSKLKSSINTPIIDEELLKLVDPKIELEPSVRSAALFTLLNSKENVNADAIHLNIALNILEEKSEATYSDKCEAVVYILNRKIPANSKEVVGKILLGVIETEQMGLPKDAAIALCKLNIIVEPAIQYLIKFLKENPYDDIGNTLVDLCNTNQDFLRMALKIFRQDRTLRDTCAKIFSRLDNAEIIKQVITDLVNLDDCELFFNLHLKACNILIVDQKNCSVALILESPPRNLVMMFNAEICAKLDAILQKVRASNGIDAFYTPAPLPIFANPIKVAGILGSYGILSVEESKREPGEPTSQLRFSQMRFE